MVGVRRWVREESKWRDVGGGKRCDIREVRKVGGKEKRETGEVRWVGSEGDVCLGRVVS